MLTLGIGSRLREFHEYNVKPAHDLLRKGEVGFLAGAVIEELTGRNPYFWIRERLGKDRIVTRTIRGHEMQLDFYDRGLSRHLFIRGVHESEATMAYRDALAELDNIVDGRLTVLEVGANIGYYVLEIADQLGDNGSILALEPDPENRSLLRTNVERNGYEALVDIHPQAADATSGERTFYRSTHSNWNRLGGEYADENDDHMTDQFSVETTTVDDFITGRDTALSDIHALRMDLEGQELAVLQGMESLLSSDGPLILFIEFHPDFVGDSEYERALSTLEASDLEIEFVNQHWSVLDIRSFDQLRKVRGSHVRVIFVRS